MLYELPSEKGLMPISLLRPPKAAHILSAGAENQAQVVLMLAMALAWSATTENTPIFGGFGGQSTPDGVCQGAGPLT